MTTRRGGSAGDGGLGARSTGERQRHAAVAVGNDADRYDVLQHEAGNGEELARSRLWPQLVAYVHRRIVVGVVQRNRPQLRIQHTHSCDRRG